jgi:hypothetical protein
MPLLFEPKAITDFIDAYKHYEKQRSGWGVDFEVAIEETYARILQAPLAYRQLS